MKGPNAADSSACKSSQAEDNVLVYSPHSDARDHVPAKLEA